MVNSIKSLLEIDENTARKFTVVHILENCVNNIKYRMLSTALTAKTVLLIIENVAISLTNLVTLEYISFSKILL